MVFHVYFGGVSREGAKRDEGSVDKARRPLNMCEIEPLPNGPRCEWSYEVDEISIYISGSETDYANRRMGRPHNVIPKNETNSILFPIIGLRRLWQLPPAKFRKYTDRAFATWFSGRPISSDRVAGVLRSDVFQQGISPRAFSLHPCALGAAALYRDSGNAELVSRMVRWKTIFSPRIFTGES